MYLLPDGYGKDRRPFMTDSVAMVIFGVEGGQVVGAVINEFAGEMTERQRAGGSLEETAEIWLRKEQSPCVHCTRHTT